MPVGRVSLKAFDEMVASGEVVVDRGPKCPKRYELAFARCEPHHAHKADLVDLADEIALRWLRRAVRFGDELTFLSRLYAIPDPRS